MYCLIQNKLITHDISVSVSVFLTVQSSGTGSRGRCCPRGRTASWTRWDPRQSCRSPPVGCVESCHRWWDHLLPTPPPFYLGVRAIKWWGLLLTGLFILEKTWEKKELQSTHRRCRAARVWSGWRWSERWPAAAGAGTGCRWRPGSRTRPASASWSLRSQNTAAAPSGNAPGRLGESVSIKSTFI